MSLTDALFEVEEGIKTLLNVVASSLLSEKDRERISKEVDGFAEELPEGIRNYPRNGNGYVGSLRDYGLL